MAETLQITVAPASVPPEPANPSHAAIEDRLVCYCLQVSEGEVLRAMAEQGATTVEDVTEHTGACAGCRGCRPRIQRLLAGLPSSCGSCSYCFGCGNIKQFCHCEGL